MAKKDKNPMLGGEFTDTEKEETELTQEDLEA